MILTFQNLQLPANTIQNLPDLRWLPSSAPSLLRSSWVSLIHKSVLRCCYYPQSSQISLPEVYSPSPGSSLCLARHPVLSHTVFHVRHTLSLCPSYTLCCTTQRSPYCLPQPARPGYTALPDTWASAAWVWHWGCTRDTGWLEILQERTMGH